MTRREAISINLTTMCANAEKSNVLLRSATESEVYGLEVYRSKVESCSELAGIVEECFAKKVDVCRLKVNANDKEVFAFLDRTGVPYQLYNMLYTNYVAIAGLPEEAFQWPEKYSVRLYQPADSELMSAMVNRIIDRKTWVNYRSDMVADRITDERELLASQSYACSFHSEDGSRASWFISFEGEEIGYFMGEEDSDGFNGTFYGILPEHRSRQHSKVVYMMMLSICRDRGYNFFKNDIGVMNIPSQKSAASQRMVPTDIYFHFELYPFLSDNWKGTSILNGRVERTKTRFGTVNTAGESEVYVPVNNELVTLRVQRYFQADGSLSGLQYSVFR